MNSRQRSRDLLTAYDHSLEQQIVGRGSNLACRDDKLWKQVEGPLREGDARETHCLGLDPLRVMEESLLAATAPSSRHVKTRAGLQGLAKAFEVLEQAALNLYLGPWREEYKVVKMYSGMFTHYIKPVLSMPQIEKLFGLLGYQTSSSWHEQLCLQSSRIKTSSLDDFLRLSCAFFLARCECHLLLAALGKHSGEAKWELSVVRERQRGTSMQVALDNTKKILKADQLVMEPFDGEPEEDLYTDEQINGGQKEAVVNHEESLHSLTWSTQGSASHRAAKTHNNGLTSLSSSSASFPTREHICISTLNCQLTKMSDLELSSSASKRQGRHPCEESVFEKADVESQPYSIQLEVTGLCKKESDAFCSCPQSPNTDLKLYNEYETFHDTTCALLQHRIKEGNSMVRAHSVSEEVSSQSESLRVDDSLMRTLPSSSAAMPSVLSDEPKSISSSVQPIAYHDCCNPAKPDPNFLCVSCKVFHCYSCKELEYCKVHHTVKQLGVCTCGRMCSRNPLVLCRYCGSEYCHDCWYKIPVTCTCGKTFDQSSSV
ncbi:spermatogenesis associated 2-like isoform X1 [Mastacembelus armatus]|uniref:Spermatogenesis associated 2-like n=1 Tax=Mastacembelus armatus TaxID=205130 RepID=A0A3Q3M7U6_9TELE|nr:spermatogenesis-associated protein 2-like protein isoform X1 [Mastacembelus armatus]XP_026166914.1 spermatogenesis-associated protein 2-like protein isoform X1 [Mastacembelus armatus]XP_026166915.1 spermatogenesis-associated protein 2-like protein isoform X1 [Mastacembelus armatus]